MMTGRGAGGGLVAASANRAQLRQLYLQCFPYCTYRGNACITLMHINTTREYIFSAAATLHVVQQTCRLELEAQEPVRIIVGKFITNCLPFMVYLKQKTKFYLCAWLYWKMSEAIVQLNTLPHSMGALHECVHRAMRGPKRSRCWSSGALHVASQMGSSYITC